MTEAKRRGRPRKYKDEAAKVKAWRKKQEGRRLDGYVDSSASWRLKKLADEWGCSLAGAVERLIMEADEKYSDVLFPDTKKAKPKKKKELEPEIQHAIKNGVVYDGPRFAHMAIAQLERIDDKDPNRDKALNRVKEWIQSEIDPEK